MIGEMPGCRADNESIPEECFKLAADCDELSPLFPPPVLICHSHYTHSCFLSGFKSETKPFLIIPHEEWLLDLISTVTSHQDSDTAVCSRCLLGDVAAGGCAIPVQCPQLPQAMTQKRC